MKILYIAMKHDYGDPRRGYSFEHYNFYDSLVKMDEAKNEVIYFPFDEFINSKGKDRMNKELIKTVYEAKPDLCFFFLFTDEINKETISEITKKSGAITFNWFSDDHWRFYNFSKYWAPLFHWISTTDSEAPNKYFRIGYKNVIKSQWACNHFLYKPIETDFKYDVTFVGQPHGERKKTVNFIKNNGINVQCWGKGWENGKIDQESMIRLFSESKINLNLSKSSMSNPFDIKPIAKIFFKKRSDGLIALNPVTSWLDNFKSLKGSKREQIKGRNFEITGSGGFLLSGEADNLIDYYKDGEEIVIFKNVNDLMDKIKYYFKHDNERIQIAKKGYERTLKDHTYEKRFQEIFKIMKLYE